MRPYRRPMFNRPNFAPGMMITLGEEEIADVSLATFHLFDDEENVLSGVQLARGAVDAVAAADAVAVASADAVVVAAAQDAEPADAASAVAAVVVAAALVG